MNARKLVIGLVAATVTMSGMTAFSQETDPSSQFAKAWANAEKVDQQTRAKFTALVGTMDEQMKEIRATTDPSKRATLMQAHHATMAEAMTVMGSMKDSAVANMLTHHMNAQDMSGHHASMKEQGIDARLSLLENRLNMMQAMMEVMMNSAR